LTAGSAPTAAVARPPAAEARRLTGPNLYAAAAGVVLDVAWPADVGGAAVRRAADAWREAFAALATRLDWPAPAFAVRDAPGPRDRLVSHFAAAPVDQLDAAVEAAELAWRAAGGAPPGSAEVDALAARAAAGRSPRLAALLGAADARGLVTCWDDEALTLGAGARGRTWPAGALPDADAVDWDAVGGVPLALVTGSNGKTTTTRIVAAALRAAGHVVGTSSTDGVRVAGAGADAELEAGDWAGPGGARLVLRDPRVTAAVLETARGGVLRRGLAVRRADAACVTNIAADHFGEYGVRTLDDLADAKLVVARALEATRGPLVLSADDPTLRGRAARLAAAPYPVCWTVARADDPAAHELVAAHAAAGGRACRVRDGVVEWHDGGAWHTVAAVADVPLADGGRAPHNLANAVTAVALAASLGAPLAAVAAALRAFGRDAADNPGRLELVQVGDVAALVDYAHNPAGLTALLDAAGALPAARRLLVLGQAGDRDDEALADLARAAWAHGSVDRVLLKEVPAMQRGRAPGEVPGVLRRALTDAGAPPAAVEPAVAPDEGDAVRRALAWARPGDLLVLPLHVERAALVAWLRALGAAGWRAGAPVPAAPAPA
jgi:UDP-N-acetylmuramyl tripeptide synthase